MTARISEGYMEFEGCNTYYRIVGECSQDKKPLLFLHGGPGSTHNSFEVLDSLADDGRMLVMYDQIGCGESQAPGRTELFNRETWVKEVIALRKHLHLDECHILGQSWGGMLLLEYLCHYAPSGIASAVLASTLPSSLLWGEEQHRMITELPQEMQRAIADGDANGDFSSPEYLAANNEFMLRHCAPKWTADDPACLTRPKKSGTEAYNTGWGPNEFTPLGNLKDFDVTDELSSITVPVLITSGVMDMSTPYINKLMFDRIPGAKWELFRNSRHMAYAEENKAYISLLLDWLNAHD